jgi:hypothetical protein
MWGVNDLGRGPRGGMYRISEIVILAIPEDDAFRQGFTVVPNGSVVIE